nr:hypothetical protein CFP56_29968 [Quercus suber]
MVTRGDGDSMGMAAYIARRSIDAFMRRLQPRYLECREGAAINQTLSDPSNGASTGLTSPCILIGTAAGRPSCCTHETCPMATASRPLIALRLRGRQRLRYAAVVSNDVCSGSSRAHIPMSHPLFELHDGQHLVPTAGHAVAGAAVALDVHELEEMLELALRRGRHG